ncbi:hypothetical protein DRB87_00420 [Pandoraea sp. XY-2]|nr:hypothetical protein DRB87_00420 [Pandoraea sp. XY-2]
MLSQQILGYPIKYYVAILTIALWLCILTYTLIRNPSTTDANHRMVMMKADMTEILANGGLSSTDMKTRSLVPHFCLH